MNAATAAINFLLNLWMVTASFGTGEFNSQVARVNAVRTSSGGSLALAGGEGVVALETSVVSQGLPPPRNLECVERMSAAIRSAGAVPAWIGVMGGETVVGLSADELAAHEAYLAALDRESKGQCIWLQLAAA